MDRCPECGAKATKTSFDVYNDGQGYERTEVHIYECKCGCLFKVTITTKKEKINDEE